MATKPTTKQQALLNSMVDNGALTVGRLLSPDVYRSFMSLVTKGYAVIVKTEGQFITFNLA